MADIQIACVLRSGGDFDAEYVEKLRDGVAENLHAPHRFVCLADCPVPCERIPLETDWPSWWAKIELFRLTEKTLYFDLDTVIAGDITELAEYPHRFTMINDVGRYERPMSGVMAWEGNYRHLFDNFSHDPEHIMAFYSDGERGSQGGPWGDGGYIAESLGREPELMQTLFPGKIVSYKWQATPAERAGASVVCYHGPPRPRETGWAA